jgi:hypothetical protein
MGWFWVVITVVVYLVVLGCVLAFFAGVSRMNQRWERVLRDSRDEYDEEWDRAA